MIEPGARVVRRSAGSARAGGRPVVRRTDSSPAVHPWEPLTGVLALAAALPAVVAGITLARQGWAPVSDTAVIVIRSEQVLSWSSPLVGQPSTVGAAGQTYGLGPLTYWILAIPLALGPPTVVPVTLGLFNGGLLGATVAVAGRHGGRALAAAVAVALVVLSRAVDPFSLADPWNPWMGIAPVVLLAAVTWAVALGAGSRLLLPAAVALASLAVQCHLAFVAPAGALLAVALGSAWGPPAVRWARSRRRPTGDRAAAAGPGRAVVLGVVAVAGACWALPLVQQLTGSPGNLSALADTGTGGSRGPGAVVAMLGRTLGIHPSWTYRPDWFEGEILSVKGDARAVDVVVAIALLVAVAAVGRRAVRRHDRALGAGVAVVVALVVAAALGASLLPADRPDTWGYATRWTPLAGLATVVLLGAAATQLAREQAERRTGRALAVAPSPAVATGLAVVLLLLAGTLRPDNPDRGLYAGADELAAAIEGAVEDGGRYRVSWTDEHGAEVIPFAIRAVVDAGAHARVAYPWGKMLGDDFRLSGARCDGIVLLGREADHRRPDPRALATERFVKHDGEVLWLSVAVLPDDQPAGAC